MSLRPQQSRNLRPRLCAPRVRLAGFALAVGLAAGCGAQTRHQVLTALFDGVPPPDTTSAAEGPGTSPEALAAASEAPDEGSAPEGPRLYVHPPFEDHGCDNCHVMGGGGKFDQKVKLIVPKQRLCYECHDEMTPEVLRSEYAWVHGPVAAGFCVGCHSPHRSIYPAHLHAAPGADLCLRCHDRARLGAEPQHQEGFDACLDCHDPHAATARAHAEQIPKIASPAATGGVGE